MEFGLILQGHPDITCYLTWSFLNADICSDRFKDITERSGVEKGIKLNVIRETFSLILFAEFQQANFISIRQG